MADKFLRELNNLSRELERKLLRDPKLLNMIGSYIETQIRKRTRLGKSVERDGGQFGKLAALAPSTVEKRKALKASGRLNSLTSPKKSNLTLTGAMLDVLGYEVQGNRIIIDIDGVDSKGASNRVKAEFHNDKGGRPFLQLSDTELKRIDRMIRDRARQLLR